MKVAIYARVSTDEQDPNIQKNNLEGYASTHGMDVYKYYCDITSGVNDSRPALNQLMFDARQKKFNAVLVYKLDRLGRSLKHLLNIAEEWQQIGIEFVCTSQGIETITASGRLVYAILGAMAEFEHELISERTKEGMKTAKNVGKRGRDKDQRKKGGYYLRYQKKGGMENHTIS